MQRILLCGSLMLALAGAEPGLGQGFLLVDSDRFRLPRPIPARPVPSPPALSYRIKTLTIDARLRDQVAEVQVSQSFVNTGRQVMETCFVFPLPYDGAIDRLTLLVDGVEHEAKLLPAEKARAIYEGYIRRNQDPALLEWMGAGMFKTSVFPVPPGAERKVTLRFTQLLPKHGQVTDFLYPLAAAKYTSHPVETIRFRVAIESRWPVKSVYSSTHSVEIKRPDERHAVVQFTAQKQIPAGDFRLFFDTAQEKLGASLLSYRPDESNDGYFLLLASPEVKAADEDQQPKTVVLVVDRSGSMAGKKIDQAKEALRFVLNNLRAGDLFNIVVYDSSVEVFRPELQRFDEGTRKQALGFVEGIYAGGSTNIDAALQSALGMLSVPQRPSFVLFLTDGLPTVGEKNPIKIAQQAKTANRVGARLISFGVGYDVNSRLLDRLSRDNRGQSGYVRPDEDIEAHVSRLYGRISAPVMTGMTVNVDIEGQRMRSDESVNRRYPKQVYDLFAGQQLVMVGRYRTAGRAKIVIAGNIGEMQQRFDFPADFVAHSPDQSFAFVEKLWAVRRIGELIDDLDLNGQNEELVAELVALSTKHGILTPYTSFLADDQGNADLADAESGLRRARNRIERLEESAGKAAFSQRAVKQTLRDAPRPQASAAATAVGAAGGLGAGLAIRDIDSDEIVTVNTVRTVGNETLYKRGNLWIAANARDVDLEKDRGKVVVVQRFSPAWFRLIKDNLPAQNKVLAAQPAGEHLLLRLRGVIYRIE